MVDATQLDWTAIAAESRFQELHHKKSRFLWGMIFPSCTTFCCRSARPISRSCTRLKLGTDQCWPSVRIVGIHRCGGYRFVYSRRANTEFDAMASEIVRDVEKRLGGKK